MYVEMVKAMGARPITTGFAEVYTGLAQGTLDLLEAPLPTMWASKFYEQAKYASLTAHMIGWDPVVMSETVLPGDAARPAEDHSRGGGRRGRRDDQAQDPGRAGHHAEIQGGRRHGRSTDVDRDAFRRATAPVYDRYPGFTPGIKATVQGLLTK